MKFYMLFAVIAYLSLMGGFDLIRTSYMGGAALFAATLVNSVFCVRFAVEEAVRAALTKEAE